MKRILSLALVLVLTLGIFALGAIGVSADTVDASGKLNFYAFETPSEFSEKAMSAIYNSSDADITALVTEALGTLTAVEGKNYKTAEGKAVVTLNGKAYEVEHYVNGGDWFRFNIEEKGAVVVSGLSYTVKVDIYNKAGDLVVSTKEETKVSNITSSNFKDERTGLNVEVDTSKMTEITVTDPALEGMTPWNAEKENVAQMFDGDTGTAGENSGTKLGGNGISGSFNITFKTAEATTIHYYTLYTGNDTAGSPNRNPIGWTLYGKDGNDWKVLDTVAASDKNVTGLGAANATPYTYKVATPGSYTEYKITFECAGDVFQMNELKLFNDPNAKTEDPGTSNPPADPPAGGNTTPKPAPTGDAALALSVVALVAVAGAVVIAKKRKIED